MRAEPDQNPSSIPRPEPSFKRRNYFINPKFQAKFIGFISVITAACMAVLHGANRYFFWKFRQLGSDFGMPPDHVFFKFIDEQQLLLDQIFFGTAVVAFLGITFAGILYSHRIAGPIYRLNKHMGEIAQGGPIRELNFRTKDFFQEIPDGFNAMLKVLNGTLNRSQARSDSDRKN